MFVERTEIPAEFALLLDLEVMLVPDNYNADLAGKEGPVCRCGATISPWIDGNSSKSETTPTGRPFPHR